jgi:hypothetical protein
VSAVALTLVVALSGCSHRSQHDSTGSVSTLTPQLCLGGPAASGTCFEVVDTSVLDGVTVGECVTVADKAGRSSSQRVAVSVKPASSC